MNEQNLTQEMMPEQQNSIRPESQLQNDMTIKDFLALLRENGLDKEVQNLNEMLDNLTQAEQQIEAMHQKIQTMQDELDRLRGDTPLTDQFKTEMSTRAEHMREHVNDLSDRLVTTKDSMIESARQGIRNFVEKGKAALHQACASMYQAGIQFFEASRNVDQKILDYHKDVRARATQAIQTEKEMRQQRSNLVRRMFGAKPKENPRVSTSLTFEAIQKAASAGVNLTSMNIHNKTKLLMKLQSHLDHHLEAVNRKPSFDEKLNDAQKRAEFGSKNSMPKDRGLSGPTR